MKPPIYLNAENHAAFEKWAFGDDFYGNTLLEDIPELWNKRHGDALHIKKNNGIQLSLSKMIELWRNENGIL